MKKYLYKPVFATAFVAAVLLTSSVTGIGATQSGNPEILLTKADNGSSLMFLLTWFSRLTVNISISLPTITNC